MLPSRPLLLSRRSYLTTTMACRPLALLTKLKRLVSAVLRVRVIIKSPNATPSPDIPLQAGLHPHRQNNRSPTDTLASYVPPVLPLLPYSPTTSTDIFPFDVSVDSNPTLREAHESAWRVHTPSPSAHIFLSGNLSSARSPSPTSTAELLTELDRSEFSFDKEDIRDAYHLAQGRGDARSVIWEMTSLVDDNYLIDAGDHFELVAIVNGRVCIAAVSLLDPVRDLGNEHVVFIAMIQSPFVHLVCTARRADIPHNAKLLARHRRGFAYDHTPAYACGLISVLIPRRFIRRFAADPIPWSEPVVRSAFPFFFMLDDALQTERDRAPDVGFPIRASAVLVIAEQFPPYAYLYALPYNSYLWGNIVRARPFQLPEGEDDVQSSPTELLAAQKTLETLAKTEEWLVQKREGGERGERSEEGDR